jgi:hypothetical protein
MAGLVPKVSHFSDMFLERPEYWRRGLYYSKIKWLIEKFGNEKVLVLFLEEGKRDPKTFISSIYRFLGVEESFNAPSLIRKINVSVVPRSVILGKTMDCVSQIMRILGMGQIIRYLRATGAIEWARRANASGNETRLDVVVWPPSVVQKLESDRKKLETLLGRNIEYWLSAELSKVHDE